MGILFGGALLHHLMIYIVKRDGVFQSEIKPSAYLCENYDVAQATGMCELFIHT